MSEEEWNKFLNKSWWGYGVKYGGIMLAGFETTNGFIYNAKSPTWKSAFIVQSWRVGLGLGGGVGAVALFGFNIPSLASVDGFDMSDWGVNVSFGPNVSKAFEAMAKSASKLTPSQMEDVRNFLHYLYNLFDIASTDGSPQLVAFDLPGGLAWEVSLNYSVGKFEVDWEATP